MKTIRQKGFYHAKRKEKIMNKVTENQNSAVLFPALVRRKGFFYAATEEYRTRVHKSTELFLDLLFALAAGFLAQTHALFGVYPFAIALLAASGKRVFPIFLGTAVGCYFLGAAGPLYLAVYAGVLLLRLLLSYPAHRRFLPPSAALFRELPALRVLSAGLAGLAMAIYELAVAGIASYTMLFALGSVFLPPLLTFVYIGFAESGIGYRQVLGKEALSPRDSGFGSVSLLYVELSAAVLLYSISLSLSRFVFFGVSVGTCFMTFVTLFASRRFGALRGCALGMIVGLAGGVSFVPSFGILGLLCGLLWRFGTPCALSVAVAGAAAWAAYAGGMSGFLAIAPEISVVSLLSWPFLRAVASPGIENAPQKEQEREKHAPGAEKPPSVYGAVYRARRLCTSLSAMGDGPSAVCEENKNTQSAKGALWADYALFSRLLGEALRVGSEEEGENSEAENLLAARLNEEGYRFDALTVLGRRHGKVTLAGLSRTGGEVSPQAVRRLCEEVLEVSMSLPRTSAKQRGTYFLESEEHLSAEAGFATLPKGEEEPSGDIIRVFSNRDGYFYTLLSDGMGTGEEARAAAESTVLFLSAMLDAGVRQGSTVRLANNLIKSGGECSATLDLCEVDLFKGTASFIKSGAAPSFVKRGKSLFRIRSRTVPLGLLASPDTERVNFDIAPGDVIVLLSDGVLPGEEADFIRRVLMEEEEEKDPKALATRILEASASQGFPPDDRTVGVIFIK